MLKGVIISLPILSLLLSTVLSAGKVEIQVKSCKNTHHECIVLDRIPAIKQLNANETKDQTRPSYMEKSSQHLSLAYVPQNLLSNRSDEEFLAYVVKNGIRVIEPGTFDNTMFIEEIDFTDNNLEHIAEGIFTGLSIKTLNLCINKIKTIDPNAFRDMDQLQHIDLSLNYIQEWDSSWFETNSLTHIHFGFNYLKELPANFLRYYDPSSASNYSERTTMIWELDLSYNNIETIDPESFSGITHLGYLALHGNKISTMPSSFKDLYHIEKLSIGRNYLDLDEFDLLDKVQVGTLQFATGDSCVPKETIIKLHKRTTLKLVKMCPDDDDVTTIHPAKTVTEKKAK